MSTLHSIRSNALTGMTANVPPARETPVTVLPVILAFLLSFICLGSILWNSLSAGNPADRAPGRVVEPKTATGSAHAAEVEGANSLAMFTLEVQKWSNEIEGWAVEYGLPSEFIGIVMQIESCGHPTVQSPSGALGLFQVMPFHFHRGEDPLDPSTNARRGLGYLAKALELSEGDFLLALAGYNGGHSLIDRAPHLWPDETQRYVHWGSLILEDLKLGGEQSRGVQAWLVAGGDSLCRRALDYQASHTVSTVE